MDKLIAERESTPPALDNLIAKKYIHTRKRARGSDHPFPLGTTISQPPTGPGVSSEDEAISILRTALLTIEAALPLGSIDTSQHGVWRPEAAAYWRSMVQNSTGPAYLMGCVVLLEDSLSSLWMYPQAKHLFACLPRHWKAIKDASVSSVAVRVWLLDSGIRYNHVDGGGNTNSYSAGRRRHSR